MVQAQMTNSKDKSTSDLMAQIAQLQAENDRLKQAQTARISFKVSEKGALSVYGLGRFPVTLYRGQWERVTDRREIARAIASLTCGDLLIVTKLDRLARSTRDLLNTLATISDKGAGFKVLDQPALDTTSAHGKLLLNILGSIAEF